MEILTANVRVPGPVMGDLEAQVLANEVAVRRTVEFLEDTGLSDLQSLSESLQARADLAMRRAIAAVPDGTYAATLDADGFEAFEEAGDPFDPALAARLKRVFEAGDTAEPMALYRDFRGREPAVDAMLRKRGLVEA